jgi:succinoglycan biosynthesis transport protein ExoP
VTQSDQDYVIDYRAVVRRRKWSLIVPAILGLVVGLLLAALLPRQYVASATLAVTAPAMSGGLMSSTEADQRERIRAVSNELLSQAVLERVATEEQLADGDSMDNVVAALRSRTSVALPQRRLQSNTRQEPDTFIVSHTAPTPDLAQRITNRLTQIFVELQSRRRETRAEETSAFLARQLEMSREKLSAAETNLREAKSTFQGRLPEQALSNLQSVSELRQQLEANRSALVAERQRLTVLDQQIEGLKQDATLAASNAIETRTRERLAGLEQQLAEARQQYTPRHPEVQRLEDELARARAMDEEERKQAAAEPTAIGVDPALRQLTAERQSARLRIGELEAATRRAEASLSAVQNRLNEAPLVEQRLMSLQQAYDFEKQQYQKVAEQHQAALFTEDLERRQVGERFVVLYSAERPATPVFPNVLLVLGISLTVGVVSGVGLALAREFLDRSVHDRRALEAEFDRAVLAEIPHF